MGTKFSYNELEAAKKVARAMLNGVDVAVEEARESNSTEHHVINIRHGSWAIEEKQFWGNVIKRLDSIQLTGAKE